jgi:hypothetical protein
MIGRITNCISGCHWVAVITKMVVMKTMTTMPSTPPAGQDGPQRNLKGLTCELVMSAAMRAKIAMMMMWTRRKKALQANDASMQNFEE